MKFFSIILLIILCSCIKKQNTVQFDQHCQDLYTQASENDRVKVYSDCVDKLDNVKTTTIKYYDGEIVEKSTEYN